MKIKLKKETSETCLVYRLYLIRTIQKYNSSKRSSLKHTLEKKKKKTAHAYFGRLYFQRENYAILTRWYLLSFNKKKKLAHAYFGRPYFSKFFGGKIINFLQGLQRKKVFIKIDRVIQQNVLNSNLILHVEEKQKLSENQSNEQNLAQFSASNLNALELL